MAQRNHPSLDQLEPRGGYTRQNTRVISKRANEVKGNATALELFLVAQYMAAELGLQLYVADARVTTPPLNPIGVPMSENLRVTALQAAVLVSKDGDVALATAVKFHNFLNGADAKPAAGKPAATPAGKPATTGKPATGKPATTAKGPTPEAKAAARLAAKQAAEQAAEDAADEDDGEGDGEEASEGPTKEEVGAKIKELMNSGMRPQAKELLSEFGAEALSGLSEDDYAAFIEKADELLIAG